MGTPSPFSFGTAPLPPDLSIEEDGSSSWLSVEGDRLERPIAVQVARLPNSRLAIIGLCIAQEDDGELTTDTLRSIRLGALTEQLAAYTAAHTDDHLGGRRTPEWRQWQFVRAVVANSPTAPLEARIRGVAATPEELQTFASVYLEELQLRPRRAMSASAKRCMISRSTANRWAAICRDRGYLPPREEEGR